MRVLWLTNDLAPRAGGIEQFLANLLARVHPETTLVVGPAAQDRAEAETHDRAQPYRIHRLDARVLPTAATRRRTIELARGHDAEVVVLGASWPLGELAPALGRALGVPVVALSHGLEAGLPGVGLGALVRRATRGLAALTTISDFTEARLAPHVRAARIERIAPGVDVERFTPHRDGSALRHVWGVPDDAVVVGSISRLVPRKGQDTLVDVWPRIRAQHPQAWLVLIGEGPLADRLDRSIDRQGPDARILRVGRVAWDVLPDSYAALDLFAMPCRTRMAGLDVEGLGIVYLEAQATGIPVIAGRSGGAPETVHDGRTGSVVDGRDHTALAAALGHWLADPAARQQAGVEGRQWAVSRWSWEVIAQRFATLLDEVVSSHRRPG